MHQGKLLHLLSREPRTELLLLINIFAVSERIGQPATRLRMSTIPWTAKAIWARSSFTSLYCNGAKLEAFIAGKDRCSSNAAYTLRAPPIIDPFFWSVARASVLWQALAAFVIPNASKASPAKRVCAINFLGRCQAAESRHCLYQQLAV